MKLTKVEVKEKMMNMSAETNMVLFVAATELSREFITEIKIRFTGKEFVVFIDDEKTTLQRVGELCLNYPVSDDRQEAKQELALLIEKESRDLKESLLADF